MPDLSSRPLRALLAAGLLLVLSACETLDAGNPLIGRWTLVAPVGMGMALGTYEFRRSSMRILGVDQAVEYSVSGDRVLVIPQGFGPTLDIEMVDRNTARVKDPITGGLLTLRRLRQGNALFSG